MNLFNYYYVINIYQIFCFSITFLSNSRKLPYTLIWINYLTFFGNSWGIVTCFLNEYFVFFNTVGDVGQIVSYVDQTKGQKADNFV